MNTAWTEMKAICWRLQSENKITFNPRSKHSNKRADISISFKIDAFVTASGGRKLQFRGTIVSETSKFPAVVRKKSFLLHNSGVIQSCSCEAVAPNLILPQENIFHALFHHHSLYINLKFEPFDAEFMTGTWNRESKPPIVITSCLADVWWTHMSWLQFQQLKSKRKKSVLVAVR